MGFQTLDTCRILILGPDVNGRVCNKSIVDGSNLQACVADAATVRKARRLHQFVQTLITDDATSNWQICIKLD